MLVPCEQQVSPAVLLLRQKGAVTRQRWLSIQAAVSVTAVLSSQAAAFAGGEGFGPERSFATTSRQPRGPPGPLDA